MSAPPGTSTPPGAAATPVALPAPKATATASPAAPSLPTAVNAGVELPKPSTNGDSEAAGNLVVPITPGGPQPDAVLPQEIKKAPPPKKRPPTRKLKPGDLICGDCGEGNAETRKFCSRCGASLAEAEIVKRPWWKHLIPRTGAKVRKSGDRPKGSRRGKSKFGEAFAATFRAVRRVVAVLLLVAGIVYGVSGQFRGWVNERAFALKHQAEKIIFQQYVPVSPVEVSATSQLPDHPGPAATDGFSNTFWAAPGVGPEPTLILRFDREVSISRALIRNGSAEGFQGLHRAERLHFVFNTGRTADVTLKDNPDPQQVDIASGDGATSVEIHVVSLFRSVKGTDLAVSEIELFQKD
ncbi:NADase-type glycan-binding domain-containing protein [Actinokineospora sp.]|uniref:NADase-type glycan-binding domain-containing protein n=1 Tax=Actinokineospora sp. TaxID=1872133 RepID=UPI003D6A7FE1